MPELPEVETIKRDLEKEIIKNTITGVSFLWENILKDSTVEKFSQEVIGKKIIGVERRAKNLIIKLQDNKNLLIHLKMTGHLIVVSEDWQVDEQGKWLKKGEKESPLYDPLNQYIRVIFRLDKGKILAFSDLRKFAYLKLISNEELNNFLKSYGPEPFSAQFTKEYLIKTLANKKIPIKKVLMDQTKIAGIGNIYADEILYDAKIHPLKPASEITPENIAFLYASIKKILKKAIELRGTSVSDYRDASGKKGRYEEVLKVYRRTGKPCFLDQTPIKRISVSGRGTHFCPTEQVLD